MIARYALLGVLIPSSSFGWGSVGHRIIAEAAMKRLPPSAFAACGITADEIAEHVNDPDLKWRQQRLLHPHEAQAHYIHVDRQPKDWRTRAESFDRKEGTLPYRILDWIERARRAKKSGKTAELKESLYGLSHYLGDLTQPLHAHSDHDGERAGIEGIHSQFESKMVARYEKEIRVEVGKNPGNEAWSALDERSLIFNLAEQSMRKAAPLLASAKRALEIPKPKKNRTLRPFFSKKRLWKETGNVAIEQIALAARLNAYVFGLICR